MHYEWGGIMLIVNCRTTIKQNTQIVISSKPIVDKKWNQKQGKSKKEKKCWKKKYKVNCMVLDSNSAITIITLNVNSLSTRI